MNVIGWIGWFLLLFASVPQTYKVLKEGHASGMSWFYIGPLCLGFACMTIFTTCSGASAQIISSYSFQLAMFSLIAVRKITSR